MLEFNCIGFAVLPGEELINSLMKTEFKMLLNSELIYFYYLFFPPSSHSIVSCVFLSCRPFVVNMTFPTRPVENVVLTTKGLQERETTIERDDCGKMGAKNKLILTEIVPPVHET